MWLIECDKIVLKDALIMPHMITNRKKKCHSVRLMDLLIISKKKWKRNAH